MANRPEKRFLDPNIARKDKLFDLDLARQTNDTSPPFFTLMEFNLSGLCNRTCVFCPRVDPKVFPNVNEHIPIELYEKIAKDLGGVRFSGTILHSGFGEPLLHRRIENLIEITRSHCPEARIEINCDGDFVTPRKLCALFGAGLTTLTISMYDGPEQETRFEAMRQEVGLTDEQFILRVRWLPPEEHYGITLSNRAGMVEIGEAGIAKLKEPLRQPCHYPFFQTMIDYDGSVLLCPHDWGKRLVIGNLNHQSIMELWDGPLMRQVRLALASSDRSRPPCDGCDVDGTLNGRTHFEKWMEHYRSQQQEAGTR